MKKVHALLVMLAMILMATSCEDKYKDVPEGIYAEIITNKGTMFAQLYHEAAPLTVSNFVALAEGKHDKVGVDSLKGKPFFNGLIFHRVIKDFMIQGGDYTGTGSGNVGYKFDQEIVDSLKHDAKGVMSMANAGPNTNGSQFFIMHKATPFLDGKYNVFGKVIEGLEVVDSIATTKTAAADRPVEDMIMKEVKIIRVGRDAKKWDAMNVFNNIVAQKEADAEKEKMAQAERAKKAPALREAKAKELAQLKSKAKELKNGLRIYKVKEGSGERPVDGNTVFIDYSGFFEDGRLFDSSNLETSQNFDNVNPAKQNANAYRPMGVKYDPAVGMVQGFKDAMLSMNYGDEIIAFIPSELAYGERGAGGVIPPNTNLVFEMKMMKDMQ